MRTAGEGALQTLIRSAGKGAPRSETMRSGGTKGRLSSASCMMSAFGSAPHCAEESSPPGPVYCCLLQSLHRPPLCLAAEGADAGSSGPLGLPLASS